MRDRGGEDLGRCDVFEGREWVDNDNDHSTSVHRALTCPEGQSA